MPQLPDLDELIQLRHTLHQHPELSGHEFATAKRIIKQLKKYQPDELYDQLGGTGVAAVFNGVSPKQGPTVLFRAELDALPIAETNQELSYKSVNEGRGHKCGHDGHMAILVALGSLLRTDRPTKGRVVLLFQPAEETGAGAREVLQDPRFAQLQPDFVFGLHNLPGRPLHQVVLREQVFSAASTGMVVELQGKPSHAAEPENGLNPGVAMATIITSLNGIIQDKDRFEDLTLLTVIHARLGEIAFGTNPGFATVMATLRAYLPQDLQKLKRMAQEQVEQIAAAHGVRCSIRFVEEFPATINYPEQVKFVQQAAEELGLDVTQAEQPFRWSEDFGHFLAKYKGAFFGIGSGLRQPQLHHSDYDFPDELISSGAHLLYRILHKVINS